MLGQFLDNQSVTGPTFRIACLFHRHFDVLERTLPRCLTALTSGTSESFEVVLHCDGTSAEVASKVLDVQSEWGIDEARFRTRGRHVASGDASNNGHRRLFDGGTRYLVVIEDDVWMHKRDPSFDVLGACRRLFESHADVPVICKLSDDDVWSWKLRDRGAEVEEGVRSVNRVATHFIAYDVARFRSVAGRFGAFDLDVFIDRDDLSYNWEDVVSHVATTGERRIAWPQRWPLDVYHCDRKVAPGSMYNTQDPATKHAVIDELEARYESSATAS